MVVILEHSSIYSFDDTFQNLNIRFRCEEDYNRFLIQGIFEIRVPYRSNKSLFHSYECCELIDSNIKKLSLTIKYNNYRDLKISELRKGKIKKLLE